MTDKTDILNNEAEHLPESEEASDIDLTSSDVIDDISETDNESLPEKSPKKKEREKKKKKTKKPDDRSPEEKKMFNILVAIVVVGVCILILAVTGIIKTVADKNKASVPVVSDNTTAVTTAPETQQNVPVVTPSDGQTATQPVDSQNGGAVGTVPSSDAEWLTFFNNSVNKIKTNGPSFTKSKQTTTADIQLSNSLAEAYVSVVKDKFLSDDVVTTNVAKGDIASAVSDVSPDGKSFVSALSLGDVKSISHSADASGNYLVHIDMNDITNPGTDSAYAKIFQFITVDDVVNTYAPNIKATVSRENISVVFSGCYAEALIAPDGTLLQYSTNVAANMILKDAKISIVTTDLDVSLISNTKYTNFVW